MRYRFTWIETGTRNAAMLGLDETVDTDDLSGAIEAAEYAAECQGYDLDRYELAVDELEPANAH